MAVITGPGFSLFGRAQSQSVKDESGGSFGCGASPLLWVKITTTFVSVKNRNFSGHRPKKRLRFYESESDLNIGDSTRTHLWHDPSPPGIPTAAVSTRKECLSLNSMRGAI